MTLGTKNTTPHPTPCKRRILYLGVFHETRIIHGIKGTVPATRLSQADAQIQLKEQLDDRRARKVVDRICDRSEIETRHSVIDDWGSTSPTPLRRGLKESGWSRARGKGSRILCRGFAANGGGSGHKDSQPLNPHRGQRGDSPPSPPRAPASPALVRIST